eukprot:1524817-Rhodomonas_salina.2
MLLLGGRVTVSVENILASIQVAPYPRVLRSLHVVSGITLPYGPTLSTRSVRYRPTLCLPRPTPCMVPTCRVVLSSYGAARIRGGAVGDSGLALNTVSVDVEGGTA